jgi:hypothetical protein
MAASSGSIEASEARAGAAAPGPTTQGAPLYWVVHHPDGRPKALRKRRPFEAWRVSVELFSLGLGLPLVAADSRDFILLG